MNNTAPRKLDYIPQLDGLRGVACLCVMICHITWQGYSVFWLGQMGVRVFFVLSGFLITRIILNDRERPGRGWGRFWVRRAARIFPLYYLSLAIMAYFYPDDIWSPFVFYTSDYSANGHFAYAWSLAVEEQFYLFWPLAAFFLIPMMSRRIAIGGIIASIAAGIYLALHVGTSGIVYFRPEPNVVLLMAGALMAFHEPAIRSSIRRPRLVAVSLLLGGAAGYLLILGVMSVTGGGPNPGGWLVVAEYLRDMGIAVPAVLYALVGQPALVRALSWRPLRYVGSISYGLYLWHPAVYMAVHAYLPGPWAATVLVEIVLSFAVAAASYHGFERPILDGVRARLDRGR